LKDPMMFLACWKFRLALNSINIKKVKYQNYLYFYDHGILVEKKSEK